MTEDRSASFVELFFDLVFVFGVTQVVASIHGHLDWPTLWRAAVVFGLLWWAWTQYTWIAGGTDFDEIGPRVVMLVATAGTFITAVSVQGAWQDDGPTFALAYFTVMALAGAFLWLRSAGTDRMAGVVSYVSRQMAGSVLVLVGGFVSTGLRPWFWVGGVAVNLIGAAAAGRYEFDIHASHFAERHGLFVIIVLGEALIAIGVGAVGHPGTLAFYLAGTAMLVTALAMWWSYFDWLFEVGRKALADARGIEQGRLARDAYSLAHYPLVAGVILFAVGTEELLAHPAEVVDGPARWAFLGGLMLFFGSQSAMARRMTGHLTWERFATLVLLAVAGAVMGGASGAVLGTVAAGLILASLTVETSRYRKARVQVR